MVRALYTSAIGMVTQMNRMDIATNNIANADTTGFKRDIAVTQSFSEELMKRLDDRTGFGMPHDKNVGKISQGVFINNVHTDFATGTLRATEGNLDLAISGTGFFAISTLDKDGKVVEKYSRDGQFTLGADRALLTKDGYNVVGNNGNIILPDGDININEDGTITVADEVVNKIKLIDVENPQTLRKAGTNLYTLTEETKLTDFKSQIMQGYVENSNINSVKEMIDLIAISRNYEANQKIITMVDTSLGQAVTDIAKR